MSTSTDTVINSLHNSLWWRTQTYLFFFIANTQILCTATKWLIVYFLHLLFKSIRHTVQFQCTAYGVGRPTVRYKVNSGSKKMFSFYFYWHVIIKVKGQRKEGRGGDQEMEMDELVTVVVRQTSSCLVASDGDGTVWNVMHAHGALSASPRIRSPAHGKSISLIFKSNRLRRVVEIHSFFLCIPYLCIPIDYVDDLKSI